MGERGKTAWRRNLESEGASCLLGPTLLVLILLLEGKGREAAFLKPHTSRTFSCVCCEVTPSGSCRQYSDGSRRKQKRETVLKSHEHPTRETKDETKRTEEQERVSKRWGLERDESFGLFGSRQIHV